MKVSKTTTSNTIAVMLTIAVLVLAWKMVLPGYFSHRNNLSSLENEVNAAKIKLDSIEKSKAELSAIKPIADQLLVAVPEGADEPDLISELEAIAIKNNIVLPSISIGSDTGEQTAESNTSASANSNAANSAPSASQDSSTAASDPSVETTSGAPIVIAFSVEGSFENLNNFIAGIEKSVRFMNIVGLTYGTDSESGGNTLALQIEAYQR